MSATRFYLEPTSTPNISPAFDGGWEQTGTAIRRKLLYKPSLSTLAALADQGTFTVPITTTQDVLGIQFVSDPIPPQLIDVSCLVSAVLRVFENASTNNVTLAIVIKIVDAAGVARGTLASNFNTGTEFDTSGATSTRILSQVAVSAVTTQPGDRIVVEIGGHAAGPTAAGSFSLRCGYNAASDFALTAALTTDLNPWIEFSKDLFNVDNNNYKSVKVGDGLSAGERIR